MGKQYYERYWKSEFSNNPGVSNTPPEWNDQDLKRVLTFGSKHISKKVLDVGCGNGYFTNALKKRIKLETLYGCDISQTAISNAKLQYTDINFLVSEICSLPFSNKYFDTLTLIEVIEHILDIEELLKELNRVLDIGGKLIITTTDFNFLKKVIISSIFFDKYFYPTGPHIRFFTKQTLTSVLHRFGFEVADYTWNGSYMLIMPRGQILVARKVNDLAE